MLVGVLRALDFEPHDPGGEHLGHVGGDGGGKRVGRHQREAPVRRRGRAAQVERVLAAHSGAVVGPLSGEDHAPWLEHQPLELAEHGVLQPQPPAVRDDQEPVLRPLLAADLRGDPERLLGGGAGHALEADDPRAAQQDLQRLGGEAQALELELARVVLVAVHLVGEVERAEARHVDHAPLGRAPEHAQQQQLEPVAERERVGLGQLHLTRAALLGADPEGQLPARLGRVLGDDPHEQRLGGGRELLVVVAERGGVLGVQHDGGGRRLEALVVVALVAVDRQHEHAARGVDPRGEQLDRDLHRRVGAQRSQLQQGDVLAVLERPGCGLALLGVPLPGRLDPHGGDVGLERVVEHPGGRRGVPHGVGLHDARRAAVRAERVEREREGGRAGDPGQPFEPEHELGARAVVLVEDAGDGDVGLGAGGDHGWGTTSFRRRIRIPPGGRFVTRATPEASVRACLVPHGESREKAVDARGAPSSRRTSWPLKVSA